MGFSTATGCRIARTRSSPTAAENPHFFLYCWIFGAYSISGNFGTGFKYYHIVDGDMLLALEGD